MGYWFFRTQATGPASACHNLGFIILVLLQIAKLTYSLYSTMASKQQLVPYIYVLILGTVMSLATAQNLRLVYTGRRPENPNPDPGANRIALECQLNSVAVSHPQIFVERSDLGKQPVTVVDGETTVIIEITQDLEGLYSCSHNGVRSINTLRLVGKENCYHMHDYQ